jgi:hypothetical protein
VRALKVMVVLVFLVTMSPAAYSVSHFGAGARVHSTINFDGLRGNMEIRTNPTGVTGVGFIHPTQLDIGPNTDNTFVAIGTAKGVGTDNCDTRYNGSWTIYTDGRIDGIYFCEDENVNAYQVGDNPPFTIASYGTCATPPPQPSGWRLYMGGIQWNCVQAVYHKGSQVSAGLEQVNGDSGGYNLDVKYSNLQSSTDGAGWTDFGPPTFVVEDYTYQVTTPTDQKLNAYKPALD